MQHVSVDLGTSLEKMSGRHQNYIDTHPWTLLADIVKTFFSFKFYGMQKQYDTGDLIQWQCV